MFTEFENFESLNKIESLPDGVYREVCSHYRNKTGSLSSIVREFTRDGDAAASACDLMIVLPDQSILFRDYMQMLDGSWRDSYGRKADTLASLFPKEIFDQRLISRTNNNSADIKNIH